MIDVLRTEPMQKVRIVSLEQDKAKVVAALHMMGAIDLRRSSLQLGDDVPASYSTELSDSLVKIDGAMNDLEPQAVARPEKHLDPKKLVEEVRRTKSIDEIYSLVNERKQIEDDQKALDYAEHIVSPLGGLKIDFGRIRSDYLAYKAFETDPKTAKRLEKALRRFDGNRIDLSISKPLNKHVVVLVAYDRKIAIDEAFKGLRLNELDLSARYLDGTPASVMKATRAKREANAKRLSEISRKLAGISRSSYSKLANLKEMLEIELDRSEVSASFKRTQSTFVVEGWVQKRQVEELGQRVSNVTRGKAHIEEIDGGELAPTYTRRPRILKPFDYMVGFYSVQRSDEIDPTWIFIISFPIFYGLMVTDVGYGLASLLLASLIVKKTDPEGLMHNAARIWQLNSFAAMFFGFISNQYFGFQLGYSTPFSFDWLKNTPELIAITVLFGVTQVIIGLAIGIVNSYGHGHKKMAYARLASIITMLSGTIAVSGAFFGVFGVLTTEISGAIAIVSILIAAALSGSEATEIMNLITHPLSYARIMGFGLGSVIIAFLIDMAFTPHMSSGILVFAVYLVIFIALHFLNMLLSIFEGIVQGIRLNFVEFFSKFYIGNGIRFKPFSYKRVYTKE